MTSSRAVRPRFGALCLRASLLWLAAASIAAAQAPPESRSESSDARPRIGLVLSGGGARGTAHIGVLKVLDELKIPVDAIAGTSMGAVVGGLYASGLSAAEIEKIMSTLDWQDAFRDRPPRADLTFRRKLEDQNFLVKFPLGLRSGRFLLPKGLVQGQKLNATLRRLTLPVSHLASFDDLPVRFRAVATDLETGAAVIMDRGDLTSAMRASLSAPGVFSPVERDGRLLVDGGLVENLPIDVVREMGVDMLIVVDVSFPLMSRERLNSVPGISNQMLAILIRKDSERQKQTLTANDILIDPVLGEASSFDFTIVKRAIDAGEKAARGEQARLAELSNPPEAAQRYAERREAARKDPPRIDFVRVQPGSERYAEALNELFDGTIGQPLDAAELDKRVTGFYGKGNLEALDYEVVTDDMGRRGLSLIARRNSWGPNYVRFGLNLQDDFEGNSRYNAAARFVLAEITQPGGEWVWDLQVGESSRIATEIYLPVSQSSPYFLLPHAQFGARNVTVLDDQTPVADYRVRSFEYGVDYGREFGNWGEIRAGLRREIGSSRVRVGDPLLATDDFDVREYFVRMSYDRLDDVNFPHRGQLSSLEWRGERTALGSERAADRLSFDWLGAKSWGRHTTVLWTSFGTALDDAVGDVRTLFPLGGFLNLSGLRADSITGRHFGIARVLYYKQIGRGGEGFLDVPTYLGLSLEAGNVWEDRSDASFSSARKNGSLYLGLDTLLGPVYLAAGYDEGGQKAFYLFLGRTF